jgi:hypothetical protein
MGYLTWKSGGNFGLWMLFLLLVVIGCKFCRVEQRQRVKEYGVEDQYVEAH